MSKRNLFALISAFLILVLLISACGGNDPTPAATDAPDTGDTGDDVEDTPTEEADTGDDTGDDTGEAVTLRVFAVNVGQELDLTRAAAQRFMDANPNITVEVVETPDFVEDRLGTYLQLFEAQSPEGDVFQIDVIWPGDLEEHFVDLNEYGGADVAANHF